MLKKHFLLLSKLKTVVLLNIFVKAWCICLRSFKDQKSWLCTVYVFIYTHL